MANKFRGAIADGLWVKELYSDDPQNPNATVLVRAIYGLTRTASNGIMTTLNSTKSVTNPVVDGAAITGTFRVIKLECRQTNDGNLSGSDVIVQTLGDGFFTTLTSANRIVLKNHYETEEQNENAWMYYARGVVIEESRWMNIANTSIASLFPYVTDVTMSTALTGYSTPVILENWYEREQDGSCSMYRTLFARSNTSVMATRNVQYAGMIITNPLRQPTEGDTTIDMSGFLNLTETVYKNAKFSIGGDTYRVTANAVAVTDGGSPATGKLFLATSANPVSIIPEITLATETLCDTDDGSAVQIYFEALS
jgi:hypothetical protein